MPSKGFPPTIFVSESSLFAHLDALRDDADSHPPTLVVNHNRADAFDRADENKEVDVATYQLVKVETLRLKKDVIVVDKPIESV